VIRPKILPLIIFLLLPGIGSAQTREKVRVALGAISVNTAVMPVGHQYGISPSMASI
jgi:hypothetical protein